MKPGHEPQCRVESLNQRHRARIRLLHTRQTQFTLRSPAIPALQFPNEHVQSDDVVVSHYQGYGVSDPLFNHTINSRFALLPKRKA